MHELIERFDGHLKAEQFYSVIANMRGDSPEAVAEVLLQAPGLQGLQVGVEGGQGALCVLGCGCWLCWAPIAAAVAVVLSRWDCRACRWRVRGVRGGAVLLVGLYAPGLSVGARWR